MYKAEKNDSKHIDYAQQSDDQKKINIQSLAMHLQQQNP